MCSSAVPADSVPTAPDRMIRASMAKPPSPNPFVPFFPGDRATAVERRLHLQVKAGTRRT